MSLDTHPVIFGAGTAWYKSPDDDGTTIHQPTVDAIKAAIDVGYRTLDGAQAYGTERELGIAMVESGIPRASFRLSTKAKSTSNVEKALEESIVNLQTDFVDLYLIHSPFPASTDVELQDAWREMERCKQRGLARDIGVSNFSIKNMSTILEVATIKPSVNQIEMHPRLYQPELYDFLRRENIAIQGFSSLAPLRAESGNETRVLTTQLAAKYNVDEMAILMRWVIDQGAAVVTTSSKRERMATTFSQVRSFKLTDEEVAQLTATGKGRWFRGFFADEFKVAEANS
ncbi:ketoreductase [Emericellopsis atlantica]|uniref:Ketoreductase n=1 Tax=Emericellopsis atlantica TaxID=2614577 RepID=A0A9P7ZVH5_9HYPO|nr:ketoreductase [Emericellopsis atlantica]KAG9258470.1 ketoreductase [Emericellopsis atlantica]